MAITLKRLAQGPLAAAVGSFYSPGAGKTGMVKSIRLCNTTSSDVPVRVFIVPSGGSPTADNAILYDAVVPANGFISDPDLHVLSGGDTLRASGLGVTLTVSGAEQ